MPRTFFRNTTALALGLGLALPHASGAQALPSGDAAQFVPTRTGNLPELARMLDKKIPSGLMIGAGGLVPADGKPVSAPRSVASPPAPVRLAQADAATATDAVPLPGGAAEGNAAADAAAAAAAAAAQAPVVVEEPAAEAPAAEPAAEPEGEPEVAAPAEAPAVAQEAPAEAVPAEPVAEPAPEIVPEEAAAARAEASPEPVEEPITTAAPAAEAPAQAAREAAPAPEAPTPAPQAQAAPEPERAAAPEAPAVVDAPSEADLARALAERSEGEAGTDAAPPSAGAAAESGAAGAAANAPGDKGTAPVARATRPADPADAAEQAASEGTGTAGAAPAPVVGGAAAGSGGTGVKAAPAADATAQGRATPTPAAPAGAGGGSVPVVTQGGAAAQPGPSEDELAAALAGAREVPEAEARPTDAAREAAAAAAPPAAAALAEAAAPVVTSDKQQVTEETSRSATEDFLTDVRGTLRQGDIPVVGGTQGSTAPVVVGADGQPVVADGAGTEAHDGDDDRSDLEKVLRQAVLPALAGLAVGQLLSNNRQVELNTGDRVVVTRPDGSQEIIKDDNALLLRPGSTAQTEEYADGSTRTIVTREDGSQVVTIRDADLRVLRRTLVRPDGTTTALIDETAQVAPVDVAALPPPARPVMVVPGEQLSEDALREALRRETQVDRTFTLGQIRNIPEVRALVAPVEIQAITFDTGSAAIKADQAQALASLGRVIADSVRQNPSEIYMIEGHTDTVGSGAMNLALSDRRAESVALALTEFFGVPPENMVVQGYGEQFLKVPQEGDIRSNRRASVRRITDLLARN